LKLDYTYGGRYEFMGKCGGLWVRWISFRLLIDIICLASPAAIAMPAVWTPCRTFVPEYHSLPPALNLHLIVSDHLTTTSPPSHYPSNHPSHLSPPPVTSNHLSPPPATSHHHLTTSHHHLTTSHHHLTTSHHHLTTSHQRCGRLARASPCPWVMQRRLAEPCEMQPPQT
jgi:hypothetical protein